MNIITLTDNETRQHDLAMAMVGDAPEGAKRYEVIMDNGGAVLHVEQSRTILVPCPFAYHQNDIFTTVIMAMSHDDARARAMEIMAAYLED